MVLDERQERQEVVYCDGPGCRRRSSIGGGRGGCDLDRGRSRWAGAGWRTLRNRHWLVGSRAALANGATTIARTGAVAATRRVLRPASLALGLLHRAATDGTPNWQTWYEHPTHVGNGLAPDQTAFVEQPIDLSVELLERVVGQDRGVHLLGDGQHESVTTTDGPGRGRNELVVGNGLVELGRLFRIDPMAEGGIDDHSDERVGVLGHERHHRLVQLGETGERAALGSDVRTVDDDMIWHNDV